MLVMFLTMLMERLELKDLGASCVQFTALKIAKRRKHFPL